jgi:hypothetical protein
MAVDDSLTTENADNDEITAPVIERIYIKDEKVGRML